MFVFKTVHLLHYQAQDHTQDSDTAIPLGLFLQKHLDFYSCKNTVILFLHRLWMACMSTGRGDALELLEEDPHVGWSGLLDPRNGRGREETEFDTEESVDHRPEQRDEDDDDECEVTLRPPSPLRAYLFKPVSPPPLSFNPHPMRPTPPLIKPVPLRPLPPLIKPVPLRPLPPLWTPPYPYLWTPPYLLTPSPLRNPPPLPNLSASRSPSPLWSISPSNSPFPSLDPSLLRSLSPSSIPEPHPYLGDIQFDQPYGPAVLRIPVQHQGIKRRREEEDDVDEAPTSRRHRVDHVGGPFKSRIALSQ